MARLFKIPALPALLESFIIREAKGPLHQRNAQKGIDIWQRLRIKLPTVQDEDEMAQAHTVEALPPSNKQPNGHGHCVLISTPEAQHTGLIGRFWT